MAYQIHHHISTTMWLNRLSKLSLVQHTAPRSSHPVVLFSRNKSLFVPKEGIRTSGLLSVKAPTQIKLWKYYSTNNKDVDPKEKQQKEEESTEEKSDEKKSDKPKMRPLTRREIHEVLVPIQGYEAETDEIRAIYNQTEPAKMKPEIEELRHINRSRKLRRTRNFFAVLVAIAGLATALIYLDYYGNINESAVLMDKKLAELRQAIEVDMNGEGFLDRSTRWMLDGIDKLGMLLAASSEPRKTKSWGVRTIMPGDRAPLLPDALPPPYGHPWTLAIDLDVLLTTVYDEQHGWRTMKRPGVDFFLTYLAQQYEIVAIGPKMRSSTGESIVNTLDPNRALIPYRLYYWSNVSNRHGVKRLDKMNRPLEKLILLDVDYSRSNSPDNVIVLSKFDGGVDKSLLELVPLLQEIALQNPKDIRAVIAAYREKGKDIREEYNKLRAQAQAQKGKKGVLSSIVNK